MTCNPKGVSILKTKLELLADLVQAKGVEALLPQNLPKEHFQYLLEIATKFVHGDSPEESKDIFTCLLFIVTAIIRHQKNYPKKRTKLNDTEIINAIQLYCIALSSEEVTRGTDIKIAPTTLENIFDESKLLEFYEKCNSQLEG